MRRGVAAGVLCSLALASPVVLAQSQPESKSPPAAGEAKAAQPFGPGQPVEVQCDEPDGILFVAQGIVDERVAFPDPFKKVGRLPVPMELPPGVYTVIVEGDRFPTASTFFEVRHQPVAVRVDAGSQDLRDLGSLLAALGGVAVLAGGVLEVSGTGEGDDTKKRKLTIPLFIGGGVALAGGITMFVVSGSSVEHNGYVPQSTTASGWRGFGVGGSF